MTLSQIHKRLLPKMGKYAGFELPLTFSKFNTRDVVINARLPNVTTVFDVSHMGIYEFNILENQNYKSILKKMEELLHINLNMLPKNKAKLSVILDNGVVLDDLIISNVNNKKIRLVVNASKNSANFFDSYDFLTKSDNSIIALQGDGSQNLLEKIVNTSLSQLYFMENKVIVKDRFEICRCGYTGEDGFEIYLDDKYAEEIYEHLVTLAENSIEESKNYANQDNICNSLVQIGGLIERDMLRLEAGLSLAGSEFGKEMDIKFNALKMPFLIEKKYRLESSNLYDTLKSDNLQVLVSSEKPIKRGPIFSEINNLDRINTRNEPDELNLSDEPNLSNVGFITSTVKSYNQGKFIAIGYLDDTIYHNIKQNPNPIQNPIQNQNVGIFLKDRKGKRNYLTYHDNFINTKYYRK